MALLFIISSIIAVIATVLVITHLNVVHALLYFIVSLLAVAVDIFLLGAHFIAVLEVIIYAGAIVVLFAFVVMLLNLGPHAAVEERSWLHPSMVIGPGILLAILFAELLYAVISGHGVPAGVSEVTPAQVGTKLYTTYLLGVELSSLLLLAGLLGAYHLGRDRLPFEPAEVEETP